MITWVMGGRRADLIPRSTSTNAINTLYNIEQGRVVYLFRPNSTSCNVPSTIYFLGGIVAGLGPLFNSTINTNSISRKIQQYTLFNLIMGVIVGGLIPISTSTFNVNYCYPIARERVDGIFWPRSTSINIPSTITRGRVTGQTWPISTTSTITWGGVSGHLIPMSTTFTTSTITWGRVDGIKRPMSTTFLDQRHFKTFFFITFIIVVTAEGGQMYGLMRTRSYTSIIPNRE